MTDQLKYVFTSIQQEYQFYIMMTRSLYIQNVGGSQKQAICVAHVSQLLCLISMQTTCVMQSKAQIVFATVGKTTHHPHHHDRKLEQQLGLNNLAALIIDRIHIRLRIFISGILYS